LLCQSRCPPEYRQRSPATNIGQRAATSLSKTEIPWFHAVNKL
jgi:hypothetical protein